MCIEVQKINHLEKSDIPRKKNENIPVHQTKNEFTPVTYLNSFKNIKLLVDKGFTSTTGQKFT